MSIQEISSYIRDGIAVLSRRTNRDIEKNRKNNFTIVIKTKDGDVLNDVDVKLTLKKHDFDFGANIFMLGQYDEDRTNNLYEKEFLKIFNTAVVPLYWEGTEPKQNFLRYSSKAISEMYRRPPVDYVIDFCKKNDIRTKGHVLLWHEFVPRWLPEDYSDIKPFIVKRFKEIGERYSDIIQSFDVVNEPSRIYDVYMRDRYRGAKCFLPEEGYIKWAFDLARRYFPSNKLILNDTVGASFHEFRGIYSGYYLNIKDLLSHGVDIDEIGMQCHLGGAGGENVYNAERFYNVLDTYALLGKTINISEISIPSEIDGVLCEDLQEEAAVQLYKVAFSHPAVTGIIWWNMTDDGVMVTKRKAGDENMPSTGLIDKNYNEKKAYKALCNLINNEWKTKLTTKINDGILQFNGFYGTYDVEFMYDGRVHKEKIKFIKGSKAVKYIYLSV